MIYNSATLLIEFSKMDVISALWKLRRYIYIFQRWRVWRKALEKQCEALNVKYWKCNRRSLRKPRYTQQRLYTVEVIHSRGYTRQRLYTAEAIRSRGYTWQRLYTAEVTHSNQWFTG
jgi:hypothetical protein